MQILILFKLPLTFRTYHTVNNDYPMRDKSSKSENTINSRETNAPTELVHGTAIHSTWRRIVFEFIKIKGNRIVGVDGFFGTKSTYTGQNLGRTTEKRFINQENSYTVLWFPFYRINNVSVSVTGKLRRSVSKADINRTHARKVPSEKGELFSLSRCLESHSINIVHLRFSCSVYSYNNNSTNFNYSFYTYLYNMLISTLNVYRQQSTTAGAMMNRIIKARAAITPEIIVGASRFTIPSFRQCIAADTRHYEHLLT